MNIMALVADASGGELVKQIASTFGVDWPHLISQIISFAIVCFLLERFAYRPILRMLEERRQQIAAGIAEREKIKNELAQTEVRRQEIMMRADTEATKVIEEAHTAAVRVREKETQKAVAEAEQILVKSREAAHEEHNRMFRELKRELGTLVIQAASMATRKILTPEDQRRMAEETLKQVSKAA